MAVLDYRGLIRRIRAAQKTQQITRTMQMVSASRLKKSQEKWTQSKPYLEKVTQTLSHLQNTGARLIHPFFEKREEQSIGLVVVTSDRGLCGTYNANVIHLAETFLSQHPHAQSDLILIGKKGDDYFKKRQRPIFLRTLDISGRPDFEKISNITARLTEAYLSRRFDAIHMIYTTYRSALSIKPVVIQLLPLEKDATEKEVKTYLEPSCDDILNQLLPTYISAKIYVSLVEAFTAENSARMIAMKNATDNAQEMIRHLTLLRNKARQAAITKELLEIVTAGEAIRR